MRSSKGLISHKDRLQPSNPSLINSFKEPVVFVEGGSALGAAELGGWGQLQERADVVGEKGKGSTAWIKITHLNGNVQLHKQERFTHISTAESSFYVPIPWSLVVDRLSALWQREPI